MTFRKKEDAGDLVRSLNDAIVAERWDEVARIIDDGFMAAALAAPLEMRAVMATLPDHWLLENPRYLLARAIVHDSSRRLHLADDRTVSVFASWVASQDRPATRDTLALELVRLQFLVAAGRFGDAGRTADSIQSMAATSWSWSGFHDVLPMTLLRVGTVRLLCGDLDAAVNCFQEARWWALSGERAHPVDDLLGNYLALAYSLNYQYAHAISMLAPWAGHHRAPEHSFAYRCETVGIFARAELALGALDKAGVEQLMPAVDHSVTDLDCGWLTHHIRARYALYWGELCPAISELEDRLALLPELSRPGSLASARLHADLADLYQAAGRFRAASAVLSEPTDTPFDSGIFISQVRLEILTGRPDSASDLLSERTGHLHRDTHSWPDTAALRAVALAANCSGAVPPSLITELGRAIKRSGALNSVVHLSAQLRYETATEFAEIFENASWPREFPTSARAVQLTVREQEILSALRRHPEVKLVAAELHISVNTAKTHLRSLYKKLDVHSRDEALRH